MSRGVFSVLIALMGLSGAALLSLGCSDSTESGITKIESPASDKADEPGSLPPLVVDKDAPLLLDEPAEAEEPAVSASAGTMADNSACFVCHANYKEEVLAARHAAENVGCVDCHGKSYAHRNDENNTTPPDVMYPADSIDRSCRKCHGSHDAAAAEVIARWQKRCPNKANPETIICTDCHGNHRLKLRSVRWDRKTGKLLPSKKDR